VVILGTISFLAISGVNANKSYYVTIQELNGMGDKAYSRHLRVAGTVQPGSIERKGTNAQFVLVENDRTLHVFYQGAEPPPDTFKDSSQALAVGTFGRDGVFHATQLQAKCASKYAPAQPNGTAAPARSKASCSYISDGRARARVDRPAAISAMSRF
jgi:cytochrome c-type biogenesis protein CcmE